MWTQGRFLHATVEPFLKVIYDYRRSQNSPPSIKVVAGETCASIATMWGFSGTSDIEALNDVGICSALIVNQVICPSVWIK